MDSFTNYIKQINLNAFNGVDAWDWQTQIELSGYIPPDILMGIRRDLVKADATREWCKWIVDQFVEHKYLEEETTFPFVYYDIYNTIEKIAGMQFTNEDKMELSKIISNLVIQRVELFKKNNRVRQRITRSIKNDLLRVWGAEPRCWLTGYKFSEEAIFNFTANGKDKIAIPLPKYVDKYMPIGEAERDLAIEVDHLHPFSLGGDDDFDNYRLICGWANKIKSNHISGYSRGMATISNSMHSKSYYYWALRLTGLRRKCEHANCENNINNSQMRVCSNLSPGKVITPLSMKVVCPEHDNMENRYTKNLT